MFTYKSGHVAWSKLKEWYQSPGVKDDLIDTWQTKAEDLELNEDATAGEYINDWVMCQKKLTDLGSGYSELEYKRRFIRGITDPDYEVTRKLLADKKDDKSIDDLITHVRRTESGLNRDSGRAQKAKARRVGGDSSKYDDEQSNRKKSKFNIPYIPNFIMDQLEQPTQRNILHWRSIWNKEGREVKHDELPSKKEDESEQVKPPGNNRSGGGKRRKKKNSGKIRRTKTAALGTKDDKDVKVLMMSDDDESSKTKTASSTSYDLVTVDPSTGSMAASISRRFHPIRRNIGKNSTIVLDSGTEATVAGGGGWVVHSYVNKTGTFGGAMPSMQHCSLPIANLITAVETETGESILIGLGGAAYDNSPEATEALLNTHDLRDNGVIVDDKAKVHGGEQRITVASKHIPLTYAPSSDEKCSGPEGKILTFSCRQPTNFEQKNMEIFWLSPFTPGRTADPETNPPIRRKAKVVPDYKDILANEQKEGVDELIDKAVDEPQQKLVRWKDCLGNPPAEIVKKTLDATTRFCEAPVEMENRENMRHHRKARILPLHPRRVKGRTDSDTFFSSVTSIRGFRCVQLFVCLLSDFLFVKCLRRESQSHSAYQDFIRDVGAPNSLLTDNSQTQTGKLWTQTSRNNATSQIHSVPHNQNQNTAERKVQDAKHRTAMTLQYSNAPLVFWCYCLYFVIDCLNFTAKKRLHWRTPMEVLHGETPDISMFRFKFWEPVWYYENPAKWPHSKKLPGRWIGIAWNHGDDFTYKIWTTPGNDWKRGREIFRNVVMRREEEKAPTDAASTKNAAYDSFLLAKEKKVKRKGRKKEEGT